MADCCIASQETDSRSYETFVICGGYTQQFTVLLGENIPARAVVSLDGAGKVVYDNTNIIGVMPYAVDATLADTEAPVYREGKFNEDLLILSAGTVDTVREDLSRVGILLEKVIQL